MYGHKGNSVNMDDIMEARVHKYRKFIVRCIRGPELISYLIPRIKELHDDVGSRLKLRLSTDDSNAQVSPVDELIDIIIRSTEPGKWKAFIDCLREADYPYLADILNHPVEAKSIAADNVDYEQKIIQLFAPDLEKNITPGEILSELYSKNIINSTDKENILARERTHGPTAATIVLLDRMQCREDPKVWYPAFLGLLWEKGYRQLVNDVDPDFTNCPSQCQLPEAADEDMDYDGASCSPTKKDKPSRDNEYCSPSVGENVMTDMDYDGASCSPTKKDKPSRDNEYCSPSVGENVMTDYEEPSMNDLSPPALKSMPSGSQTYLTADGEADNLYTCDTKSVGMKDLNIPVGAKPKIDDIEADSSTPKYELRDYQLELAEHGLKGRNTVIFAETGSGKTFVALHIVRMHLESVQLAQRKVVFMARTNVLIQQQAKLFQDQLPQFRIRNITGDSEESTLLGQMLPGYDILFLTPQILINNLERGYIPSLTEFSLLFFDECHHTHKEEPYNRLMMRYLLEKEEITKKKHNLRSENLPQIIGLTASFGVGKAHVDVEARDHILRVCANLDVRHLSTVRKHKEELMKNVNTPKEETVQLKKRDTDPCRAELLKAINITEDRLSGIALLEPSMIDVMFNCPQEKSSQVYEKWTIDTMKMAQQQVDDRDTSRNISSCAKYLNVYNAALEVNHLLGAGDIVMYLADRFKIIGQQAHKLTDTEKCLLAELKDVQKSLMKYSKTDENPNLRFVSDTLCKMLKDNGDDSRAMVFVKTRATCKALAKYLHEKLQAIGTGAKPLYGKDNRGDEDGMTEAIQNDTMEKFNKGDFKVIVATSVGTEGIDVPNCDIVLSYNYSGNEITKIQMKGRSRKKGGTTLVVGNEDIVNREKINAYKAHMMYRAMSLVWQMKQADVEQMVNNFQKAAIISAKIERDIEKLKVKPGLDNEYQLICKGCKSFACNSSDIRQVLMFRFVIDPEFESRIEIRAHKKPLTIEGFKKKSKIYCKKCPMDWGIICIYKDTPCFTLKIENFILSNPQKGETYIPAKKWKDIPFNVPEVKPEEVPMLVSGALK